MITQKQVETPTGTDWLGTAVEVSAIAEAHESRHDAEGSFVTEAYEAARNTGLIIASIPAELGGGGLSHADTGAAISRIAHGSPSAAVALSMHYHPLAALIWRYRRDGTTGPALARLAQQRAVLVTSGAGDWLGSSGSARKTNDGFVVTARKSPISGAPGADILVGSSRWDSGDGSHVVHFALPIDTEGISIEPTWNALGLRGSGSHTVVFDDVFVPDESVALVRPADEWHPIWGTILVAAIPLIMSAYVGIAERAASIALETAGPGIDSLVPTVGDMHNSLTAARDAVAAMFHAAGNLSVQPTKENAVDALARKSNAATALRNVVDRAVEIVGGRAFVKPHPLERLARDIRGVDFHPLPPSRQRWFTGRATLGLEP